MGNVALKVSEGLSEMIRSMLRESLEATVTRKIGYALSRSAYTDFKKRVDYAEYGGAPLLGVKGVCTICHGRSDSNAIKNAIRVRGFASSNMNHRIEEGLREFSKAGKFGCDDYCYCCLHNGHRVFSDREIQSRPVEIDGGSASASLGRPSSGIWKRS